MMIKMAQIEEPLQFWQDLTFSDDVMEGLTIKQKRDLSTRCMKELKRWMERKWNISGIWKREWVKRKSGKLNGQYVPHYHCAYTIEGMDEIGYLNNAMTIAQKWVKITGTKNEINAVRVALHHKSYRLIKSRKHMQKYMSKYFTKGEEVKFTESIGRNWGRIGSPKMDEGEIIHVREREMVLFKRCLRKIVKRARGYFKAALKEQQTQFFIFMEKSTVIQYIEWLRVNTAFEGVPF